MTLKFIRKIGFFNRRKGVRLRISCLARYQAGAGTRPITCLTNIVNLSEGGAQIVTFEQTLAPGTRLDLQFQLPGLKNPVKAAAEVSSTVKVREKLFRSGVRFLEMREEDRKALKGFIEARIKKTKK